MRACVCMYVSVCLCMYLYIYNDKLEDGRVDSDKLRVAQRDGRLKNGGHMCDDKTDVEQVE